MPYIPKDEVLTQFKSAPKLLGMMDSHAEQYNELEETFGKFVDAYALATAVGSQLDALGFLLGFNRPLTRDLDKYFTFLGGVGKGFGNRFGTVDGGQLIGYTEDGIALADDGEYRDLLYIKIFANLSKTTPDDMIQTVNLITGTQSIYTEGYEGIEYQDEYIVNGAGSQVINASGDSILANPPVNTFEPAKLSIQVIGAEDVQFKNFLESFLAKPLGVRLEILPYPIIGSAVETQLYTGTGTGNTITTVNDMTLGLSYFKNINAVGNNMLVSNISGERNALSLNNTDKEQDIGVQYVIEESTILAGGSDDANKLNDQYMLFSIPMSKRNVIETSDGLTCEYNINDATGFSAIVWIGSGSDEQHIPIPFNRPVSMMMSKNITDGGDMVVVGASLEGFKMKVNTDEPAEVDPDPEIRLLSAGIAVNGDFNVLGKKYLSWVINENRAYTKINSYKSTGILFYTITVGFEPSIIMIKRVNGNGDWLYFSKDIVGATYPKSIRMNTDEPALDDGLVEFISTGFRINTADSDTNENGGEYSYIAIRA